MAGKVSIPQASIFTSDPLEQIFAKGVTDREMSGLSNMFLFAQGLNRANNQDVYLAGVDRANKMALREAQMEQEQKMMEKLLQAGTDLAKEGYDVSNMPIMSRLMTDPGKENVVANLWRAWKQAQINKANAEASNSGGDQYEVKTDIGPDGQGVTTIRTKGRTGEAAIDKQAALIQRLNEANRNSRFASPADAEAWRARRTYGQ